MSRRNTTATPRQMAYMRQLARELGGSVKLRDGRIITEHLWIGSQPNKQEVSDIIKELRNHRDAKSNRF